VRLGTDPLNPDTDGDRIRDGRDPAPLVFDPDLDGDGIRDQDDPDIDGDGLSNEDEMRLGTDARRFDTDGDGWPDYAEDLNGDGSSGGDASDWTSYNSVNGFPASSGLLIFTPLQ